MKRPTMGDVVEGLVLRVRGIERALGLPPAPTWPAPGRLGPPVHCHFARAARWSQRQGQHADLSGVDAAWVVDAAELAPWADLLATLPALQLGSATSAGLGVLKISSSG